VEPAHAKRLLAPVIIALALFSATAALAKKAKPCETDADCKGKQVCYEKQCKKLKKSESLIRVKVVEPGGVSGSLYIDEVYRGECPWEGIIEPGLHWMHVEAPKMLPSEFQVESQPRKVENVEVRLSRDPALDRPPPPPEDEEEGEDGPRGKPGMLSVALIAGAGFGTAQWGENKRRRPAAKWQIGGALGARVLEDPVWLDVSLAAAYSAFVIKDPPGATVSDLNNGWTKADLGDGLQFGPQARLLLTIIDNFLLLGGDLELGYIYSEARYVYGVLSPTGSLFVTEWLEIRINPVGFQFIQELTGAGFVAAFYATVGVAVRFFNP
jgi:hypothetical protein